MNDSDTPQTYKLSCMIPINSKEFLIGYAIAESKRLDINVTISDIVNSLIKKAMREHKENEQ